jgi:mycobactin salicyl-AMP ligase
MMEDNANQVVTLFASEFSMTALARAALPAESPSMGPSAWSNVRLFTLLAATADRNPHRLAFGDQPGRESWSGRPRIAWTYANTLRIIERLAAFLANLDLPSGTPVGICLPNGSEACVTILAVERAGYTPCLLPIGWSEERLGQALEAANVTAVICQGRLAEEHPAEMFCHLAARYYGIRFICAFGPHIPDGVIDLDRAILDTAAGSRQLDPTGLGGLVTFQEQQGALRPLFRPYQSSLAAAVAFLVPQTIKAGDRILTLLAPDDHRGLTTGLVASLVTGATLEGHGLVDSASLTIALDSDVPTHLVAPGWAEKALAAADLPESVVSAVLVHEAPVRFRARGELSCPVTDVLSFGETALLTRARSESGHLLISLDENSAEDYGTRDLLRIRRDDQGVIHFGGSAAETYEFVKGSPVVPAQDPPWRASDFKADLFAGTVIGVR